MDSNNIQSQSNLGSEVYEYEEILEIRGMYDYANLREQFGAGKDGLNGGPDKWKERKPNYIKVLITEKKGSFIKDPWIKLEKEGGIILQAGTYKLSAVAQLADHGNLGKLRLRDASISEEQEGVLNGMTSNAFTYSNTKDGLADFNNDNHLSGFFRLENTTKLFLEHYISNNGASKKRNMGIPFKVGNQPEIYCLIDIIRFSER